MNLSSIKADFKGRVCEQIDIEQEGDNRFFVTTPFRFGDGDHYVVILKKEGDHWILTDEAHTLMHLSYWMDDQALQEDAVGNRKEIMDSSLSSYFVQNRGGELVTIVKESRFGDALFNFIQALTKVSDISYLSKERDFAGGESGLVNPDRHAGMNQAASVSPHDCYSWNRAHYVSTADYRATVCGSCDKIIGFRWRSWRRRLRSLFTSEPDHRTIDHG